MFLVMDMIIMGCLTVMAVICTAILMVFFMCLVKILINKK